MIFSMYFMMIVLAAFMGLLPGFIAKSKGHNFWVWWIYGWLFFVIAIIHVMFISDYVSFEQQKDLPKSSSGPARVYSLLAGLCFLIVSLYNIFQGVRFHYIMIPSNIFFNGILLALAVILFVGKWNIGVFVVCVLYFLWDIPNMVFNTYGVIYGYSTLFLALLTAGSVLPPLRKNAAKMVKKSWFLPGVYYLLSYVLQGMTFGIFYFTIWYNTFNNLLIINGLFMMGLWLRTSWTETRNQEPVVIYTKPYVEQSVGETTRDASEISQYLNSYQKLVDSGVMTKEEFEEKKRQLQRG